MVTAVMKKGLKIKGWKEIALVTFTDVNKKHAGWHDLGKLPILDIN